VCVPVKLTHIRLNLEEEHSTLPPDELNGMEEEQIQKHMAIALYLRGSPLEVD
jgi:hypothetical protein